MLDFDKVTAYSLEQKLILCLIKYKNIIKDYDRVESLDIIIKTEIYVYFQIELKFFCKLNQLIGMNMMSLSGKEKKVCQK